VRLRIGDDARILVRGPMLMSGYRLRPDLSAEALVDGWLVTSDLGGIDDDGRLRVTGRVADVVITGGENVVTSQVAAVLSAHPDLADVVVTGIDDREWGQRIVALVVPRQEDVVPSLADLRKWCGDRLSAAARPRALVVLDEIPKLASGKPDRLAVTRLANDLRDAGR
jgi:O-succinylbenzoic acid--CoA ligase